MPPLGTPPAAKRNSGGASFGDIALSFGKYVAALTQLTGYLPPDASIALAALSTAKTEMDALNKLVAEKEVTLTNAQGTRRNLYEGENGLTNKMKAIKDAVKGQYGQSSPQFQSVKSIKL